MDKLEERLRNDLAVILGMTPLLISQNGAEYPYLNNLMNDLKNNRKLDGTYQRKIGSYLSRHFRETLNMNMIRDEEIIRSYDEAVELIIKLVDSMELDNPLSYYDDNKAVFSNEIMNEFVEENRTIMKDVFSNISSKGREGLTLSALKDAYQIAFEKLYLRAHDELKKILSGIPTKEPYPSVEKILCCKRTFKVNNSIKSDFRHLRNILSHSDFKRCGGFYLIRFNEETEVKMDADEFIKYLLVMSIKAPQMHYICNLFMLMKVYNSIQ